MIGASCIVLMFLTVLVTAASALVWDPYQELASPDAWDQLQPGEALMFAGTDPGGANKDSGNFLRIEPKGADFAHGDWVMAEMNGPGSITRIWVTGKNSAGEGPRICGRIKIYVEAKDKPVVDLPIEDFFGRVEPFVPPLATPTSGGWVCYLPIPFSTYCKVVVTDHEDGYAHRVNGLGQAIPHLYYHVSWRKAPADAKVEPFSMKLSDVRKNLLRQATARMEWKASTHKAKQFRIPPGEKVEMFSSTGKGRIEEFSLITPDLADLRLTAHWDGSDNPAIDAPARIFFSEGLEPRPYNSLPFRFDGKVHSCRFPMPFASGATLCLENTSETEVSVGVATEMAHSEQVSPLRFHAAYIDQHVAKGSSDILILDTKNGPGAFVGMAMVLPDPFLEGNESISIDGSKPEWTGTGTEDYFNGGWYFCFGPYDQAFSGCIHKGDYVAAYRFHLTDAAPFSKSIKVRLQHGGINEESGRARGVAYWYETAK